MAGQTMNPAADWSERRVLTEVAQQYASLTDISHVDNRSLAILGEARTVEQFAGTTTVGNDEIDVFIHVTKFTHDGDVVVGIGVHPSSFPDEQDRQDDMFSGIQH